MKCFRRCILCGVGDFFGHVDLWVVLTWSCGDLVCFEDGVRKEKEYLVRLCAYEIQSTNHQAATIYV
jgi:hypothetical protein